MKLRLVIRERKSAKGSARRKVDPPHDLTRAALGHNAHPQACFALCQIKGLPINPASRHRGGGLPKPLDLFPYDIFRLAMRPPQANRA